MDARLRVFEYTTLLYDAHKETFAGLHQEVMEKYSDLVFDLLTYMQGLKLYGAQEINDDLGFQYGMKNKHLNTGLNQQTMDFQILLGIRKAICVIVSVLTDKEFIQEAMEYRENPTSTIHWEKWLQHERVMPILDQIASHLTIKAYEKIFSEKERKLSREKRMQKIKFILEDLKNEGDCLPDGVAFEVLYRLIMFPAKRFNEFISLLQEALKGESSSLLDLWLSEVFYEDFYKYSDYKEEIKVAI